MSEYFFPVFKSNSVSPVAKTFNHRLNEKFHSSLMSALHCGYRTCMFAVHHEKAWILHFSRPLLITDLSTLSLEKYSIVLEKVWKIF